MAPPRRKRLLVRFVAALVAIGLVVLGFEALRVWRARTTPFPDGHAPPGRPPPVDAFDVPVVGLSDARLDEVEDRLIIVVTPEAVVFREDRVEHRWKREFATAVTEHSEGSGILAWREGAAHADSLRNDLEDRSVRASGPETVVTLDDGIVPTEHLFGSENSLLIEPIRDAAREASKRHRRAAEILGTTYDPRAVLAASPDVPLDTVAAVIHSLGDAELRVRDFLVTRDEAYRVIRPAIWSPYLRCEPVEEPTFECARVVVALFADASWAFPIPADRSTVCPLLDHSLLSEPADTTPDGWRYTAIWGPPECGGPGNEPDLDEPLDPVYSGVPEPFLAGFDEAPLCGDAYVWYPRENGPTWGRYVAVFERLANVDPIIRVDYPTPLKKLPPDRCSLQHGLSGIAEER